jgi:hypothetical protein
MKDLFDQSRQAFTRPTDLQTSHEAEKRINSRVPKLEQLVYQAIKDQWWYGATWDELAPLTGLDKGSISPRFKPLRKKGLIAAKLDENGNTVKRGHQTVWVEAWRAGVDRPPP